MELPPSGERIIVNVCVLRVNVFSKWVNVGECLRLVSSIMSIVYCKHYVPEACNL